MRDLNPHAFRHMILRNLGTLFVQNSIYGGRHSFQPPHMVVFDLKNHVRYSK
jgi:hypothetical protein